MPKETEVRVLCRVLRSLLHKMQVLVRRDEPTGFCDESRARPTTIRCFVGFMKNLMRGDRKETT